MILDFSLRFPWLDMNYSNLDTEFLKGSVHSHYRSFKQWIAKLGQLVLALALVRAYKGEPLLFLLFYTFIFISKIYLSLFVVSMNEIFVWFEVPLNEEQSPCINSLFLSKFSIKFLIEHLFKFIILNLFYKPIPFLIISNKEYFIEISRT